MSCCASLGDQKEERKGIKTSTVKKLSTKKGPGLALGDAKVVLLGGKGVGKSSIAQRFINNKFSEAYIGNVGVFYYEKSLQLKNGASIKLHLWDTCGEERFRALTSTYYRDATAAILVYDVTDEESFKAAEYWMRELEEKSDCKQMAIILAGNKSDIVEGRKIDPELIKAYAKEKNILDMEVSAKTGDKVGALFQVLAEQIQEKRTGTPTSV